MVNAVKCLLKVQKKHSKLILCMSTIQQVSHQKDIVIHRSTRDTVALIRQEQIANNVLQTVHQYF